MPLPRLIPCLDVAGGRVVKGVKFQELRDVGDPVELGAAYSDARCGRARLPRRLGDARGARHARRRSCGARRRAARDPVHGRRRHPFGRGRGCAPEAGADKIAVNSAALASPALITALAETLGSQAVVVAIDTEGGRVGTRAPARRDAARGTVEWAMRGRGARRGGDAAHLDRLRRDARGL